MTRHPSYGPRSVHPLSLTHTPRGKQQQAASHHLEGLCFLVSFRCGRGRNPKLNVTGRGSPQALHFPGWVTLNSPAWPLCTSVFP